MPICPTCGREAPIVYRGVVPCCTACGALRLPLSSASVNLAGKPARVGGVVATVAGGLVLLSGAAVAFGVWSVFAIFRHALLGLAFASPIGVVSAVVGSLLIWRGGLLQRDGALRERDTQDQAILQLIGHRGSVTAFDVAIALGIGVEDADAKATSLAKRQPERVTLDVDDDGVVRFRLARWAEDVRVRVGAEAGADDESDLTESRRAPPHGHRGAAG